jgi:signal transduction histidine kinase/DNA-binding response OmpR family regulator
MSLPEKPPRLRVLHVDDFDEFLEEFRALFGQDLDLTSLQDPREALALLETEPFDAVVVDFEMPEMDGLAFMEAVKAKWPLLPVVFCTGQGSEEVARQAFTSGAADYFVKDFSFFVDREKLLNSLRRAVTLRAAEERLREERRILELIIESNPYSIQTFDKEGHAVRANPASLALWGSKVGPEYRCFEDENLLARGYGPLFDQIRAGRTVNLPPVQYNPAWIHPEHGDHERWVGSVGFPLLDARGGFDGMVIMHEDITARVQAEEALKKALADLQESHALLERRVEERTGELAQANRLLAEEVEKGKRLQSDLVRKNRELEEFSSRVSHDLRNELLVLKRTLELATSVDPETQERSAALLERYDHLIQFVERLLSLARAGASISRRLEIPAEPLLRDLFERLHPPEVPARLNVSAEALLPGDPVALEQVFNNLLCNSFHYRNPEREVLEIEVEVQPDGPETRVVYRDNGVGIEPANLDRIFDMSFTTNRKSHFGLGLSLVKKIVDAHGGQIRAESPGRGQGASFHLRLPLPLARRRALAAGSTPGRARTGS